MATNITVITGTGTTTYTVNVDRRGPVGPAGEGTNSITSDPTGVAGADAIVNIISLTQAEYDAITPSSTTLYVIV